MLFVILCLRVPVQQFQEFFFVVGISALIGVSVEAVLPHDGLLLRGHQTAQLHHACELEKHSIRHQYLSDEAVPYRIKLYSTYRC